MSLGLNWMLTNLINIRHNSAVKFGLESMGSDSSKPEYNNHMEVVNNFMHQSRTEKIKEKALEEGHSNAWSTLTWCFLVFMGLGMFFLVVYFLFGCKKRGRKITRALTAAAEPV